MTLFHPSAFTVCRCGGWVKRHPPYVGCRTDDFIIKPNVGWMTLFSSPGFCGVRWWMDKASSTLRLTIQRLRPTTRAIRTPSRIARPVLRGVMKVLLRDCSLSAVVAGFIATIISYAGPLVIIFQAAKAGGLP